MAEAALTNPRVHEIITDTSSITVPAGEVWKVQAHSYHFQQNNRGGLIVNGTQVTFVYDNNQDIPAYATFPTVFVGGDTLAGGDPGMVNTINGYRVDTGDRTIDNTPISTQLASGESVTVPTGETWDVSIIVGTVNQTRTNLNLNGNIVAEVYDNGDLPQMVVLDLVLTENDTLDVDGSGGGAQIGGFKL